jgi:FlaA1/EpsC-like NDP-sugar epimerase
MWQFIRNRHLLVFDAVLLIMASYISFVLRLEQYNLGAYWPAFFIFAGVMLFSIVGLYMLTGVYSRYWPYASVEELVLLCKACSAATLVGIGVEVALVFVSDASLVAPNSVPLIFLLLALAFTAAPRYSLRLLAQRAPSDRNASAGTPTLIVGANTVGAQIARELVQHPRLNARVVGFVDGDMRKLGTYIHGVPVLGPPDGLAGMIQQHGVREVIIALPEASGKAIKPMLEACERSGARTKIVPAIYQLLDGKVSVSQLREVRIEDLLRRQPIQTDVASVLSLIKGRRVLVTGAGGSIGSELCRQLLSYKPAEIILLGHGENSIFAIQNELLGLLRTFEDFSDLCKIQAVIADIRFPERLVSIFQDYAPEIVFHAAAHKHVPLMEANVAEAVTNNILGTRNVLRASQQAGVGHLVMISSDKAVNPTSIMGASKRIAELLVHQAAKRSGKPFMVVRFGNVLGSRGSVVPTFKRQIAAGGPVTVTHPDMERYFMTIPEAVQLVLQAAVLGQGGEIYCLDMGEPVKIADLARQLIELSGLRVGHDIDIAYTGMRPGEKLFEELFVEGEEYERTMHTKIFTASNAGAFVPADLDNSVDKLAYYAERDNSSRLLFTIRYLIPQFRPEQDASEPEAAVQIPVSVPMQSEVTLKAMVVGS